MNLIWRILVISCSSDIVILFWLRAQDCEKNESNGESEQER